MTDLATGRYATFDPTIGVPVATTVGLPKFPLGYEIRHRVRRLAPWGLMDLDGDEFVTAYRERLDRLDVAALAERFDAISATEGGSRLVLLCYEDVHAGQACHRRLFADWWHNQTAQLVPEVEGLQLRLDVGRLTPAAEAEVQAILDGAARRLLEDRRRTNGEGS